MAEQANPRSLGLAGIGIHAVAYAALWVLLSGGEASSWLIGLPAIVIALCLTAFLAPVELPRLNAAYLPAFVAIFIGLSVTSGVDVARRAMGARVRLDPALLYYQLRLKQGTPRFVFMILISLLPGTLSGGLQEDTLTVHVLDRNADNAAALSALEAQVGRLFRISLGPPAQVDK